VASRKKEKKIYTGHENHPHINQIKVRLHRYITIYTSGGNLSKSLEKACNRTKSGAGKKRQRERAGGCSYHNFLAPHVGWNIHYMFGILTSRAINWYFDYLIMRGHWWVVISGGSEPFGGVSRCYGPLPASFKHIFGFLSLRPFDWHPCWVNLTKGGVPSHWNAWDAPK